MSYLFKSLEPEQFRSATAVGFVMGSYMYSWDGKSIYLNDIVVKESYRLNGIGKMLFKRLLKHAKETKSNRIEIAVLSPNPVQEFLKKMGAINVTERDAYQYYRVHRDVINTARQ